MPIIPKLECRVETFREDGAVFMRIGIHQEEMLLAYYAFDTLLTGFADKIALHDHENGADFPKPYSPDFSGCCSV